METEDLHEEISDLQDTLLETKSQFETERANLVDIVDIFNDVADSVRVLTWSLSAPELGNLTELHPHLQVPIERLLNDITIAEDICKWATKGGKK